MTYRLQRRERRSTLGFGVTEEKTSPPFAVFHTRSENEAGEFQRDCSFSRLCEFKLNVFTLCRIALVPDQLPDFCVLHHLLPELYKNSTHISTHSDTDPQHTSASKGRAGISQWNKDTADRTTNKSDQLYPDKVPGGSLFPVCPEYPGEAAKCCNDRKGASPFRGFLNLTLIRDITSVLLLDTYSRQTHQRGPAAG